MIFKTELIRILIEFARLSRTCFLFRHPRLLVPYKALAEPFVYTTWAATFFVSVLVIVLLRIIQSVENEVLQLEKSDRPSWSAPILNVVGVLSQQGNKQSKLLVL